MKPGLYKKCSLYKQVWWSLLFLILHLDVFFASAQIKNIRGRILDEETRDPIPFAMFFFPRHPGLSILSDLNGNFCIPARILPDSARISAGAYADKKLYFENDSSIAIQVLLKPDNYNLGEVVITARREDPAYDIIRKAIAAKKSHHKQELDSYAFEKYSKLKFGIKNVNQQLKKRKIFQPFKFILDNIDSTEEEPYLPVFFTESVSEIWYKKAGRKEKEVVKAIQSSGISNSSVSTLFDDLSAGFYIYDNFLPLFNKDFISPVSDHCFSHYRYELVDSLVKDRHWVYNIRYWPKRKQELTFAGTLWIADTSFAVTAVTGSLSETANLNFITSLIFLQHYGEVEGGAWINTRDELVVNGAFFIPHELREQKFIAKKVISVRNFAINRPMAPEIFKGEPKEFIEGAYAKTHEQWVTLRHDLLTKNESAIYTLVDSIKSIPLFKNLLSIFTGFKKFGMIEIGPYYKIYSYNAVEGSRFRLGFRTNPQLSKSTLLDGYAAYGLRDHKIKYGAGVQYFFKHKPRSFAGIYFKHDVEQLGFTQNIFRTQDNFLYTIFRIFPYSKLNRVNEGRIFFEKDLVPGVTSRLMLRRSIMQPAGSLHYEKFTGVALQNIGQIQTTEISLTTHLSYKEKFLYGSYNKLSLGSPFPVADIVLTSSIKNLGSDYEYKKVVLGVHQDIGMKTAGRFRYRLEGGKIAGLAPFPFLEIHSGNQTLFYDPASFSTMNFFEFVSDTYASGFFAYHLDGLLLNRIPGVRRLKLREVITYSTVVGTLTARNKAAMALPEKMYVPGKPFMEAGFGLENIFRVLRIDAIWRLSHLDHTEVNHFVVKGSLQFEF